MLKASHRPSLPNWIQCRCRATVGLGTSRRVAKGWDGVMVFTVWGTSGGHQNMANRSEGCVGLSVKKEI